MLRKLVLVLFFAVFGLAGWIYYDIYKQRSITRTLYVLPEMVFISAGDFLMGASKHDQDARSNELPRHPIIIAKAFEIGRFEVSFNEYDVFAAATGRLLPKDEGWGRGQRPVINVSWQDAIAYTAWLSGLTGDHYRLPTEAEWEYVARAGSSSIYWWGDYILADYANCKSCKNRWDNKGTVPIGTFKANPFGVYDVAGNVSEWVQDCYRSDYSGRSESSIAWETPNCELRVMRGGAWYNAPRILRSSLRSGFKADFRVNNGGGFRLVRDF